MSQWFEGGIGVMCGFATCGCKTRRPAQPHWVEEIGAKVALRTTCITIMCTRVLYIPVRTRPFRTGTQVEKTVTVTTLAKKKTIGTRIYVNLEKLFVYVTFDTCQVINYRWRYVVTLRPQL
jgi:hypothetical protein